jgi:hypothetical protein
LDARIDIANLSCSYTLQSGLDPFHSGRLAAKSFLAEFGTVRPVSLPPAADTFCLADTGSADFWIPSSSCLSAACAPHAKYVASKSTTSTSIPTKKLSITYGDRSFKTGTVYNDMVSRTSSVILARGFAEALTRALTMAVAGFNAARQAIGAATGLSLDWMNNPKDGLLGMSYQSIAQMGEKPSLSSFLLRGCEDAAHPSFCAAHFAKQGREVSVLVKARRDGRVGAVPRRNGPFELRRRIGRSGLTSFRRAVRPRCLDVSSQGSDRLLTQTGSLLPTSMPTASPPSPVSTP